MADLAAKGTRALGVAESTDDGKSWSFLGILPMLDPPRDDSRDTIQQAKEHGLRVKMVTGDDVAIGSEISGQLGMGTHLIAAADMFTKDMDMEPSAGAGSSECVDKADGFGRVFPEHKYGIVKALQDRDHVVAMTGDGVNDAPALKQADCGIAVSGATDAARAAAALILTAPGLSTIIDAIDEARRIFERIINYILFRVAMTLDIMFVVVLATVFFGFSPLTPVMIILIALLDDIPIMTIAYDNTLLPKEPVRWHMRRAVVRFQFHGSDGGGANVRSVAHRHGMAEQSRVAVLDQADPGADPDRRVPADRRGRPPAAVRDAQPRAVLQPPLAGHAAVPGRCRHPDLRGPDVRFRLVCDRDPLDRHRDWCGPTC